MGLFRNKNKSVFVQSTMSEAEIQRKLYGEFVPQTTPAIFDVTRDVRKKEPTVLKPQISSADPKTAVSDDLFSRTKEVSVDENEEKEPVSLKTQLKIENKKIVVGASSSEYLDPYARFKQKAEERYKRNGFLETIKIIFVGVLGFFQAFGESQNAKLRKTIYAILAVLCVTGLFFAINSLNAKREAAMSIRYETPSSAPRKSAGVSLSVSSSVTTDYGDIGESPISLPSAIQENAGTTSKTSAVVGAESPAAVKNTYVIQVVTYPTKADADRIVSNFRKEGLKAYVKENVRPSGRVFYLVLLGGFKSEPEAQAQLLKFRKMEIARPFQDAFVKSSK